MGCLTDRHHRTDARALSESSPVKLVSIPSTISRPPWWTVCFATALMIPLLSSSLGGLTHRISCRTEFSPDFDVLDEGGAEALVSSSIVLTRDAPATSPRCPGFTLDATVNPSGPTRLSTALSATNASTSSAHVTAQISVDGRNSYLPIGVLGSGQTIQKTFVVNVPKGSSVLRARLLLGG